MNYADILKKNGVKLAAQPIAGGLEARTPVDGSILGYLPVDDTASVEAKCLLRRAANWCAVLPSASARTSSHSAS